MYVCVCVCISIMPAPVAAETFTKYFMSHQSHRSVPSYFDFCVCVRCDQEGNVWHVNPDISIRETKTAVVVFGKLRVCVCVILENNSVHLVNAVLIGWMPLHLWQSTLIQGSNRVSGGWLDVFGSDKITIHRERTSLVEVTIRLLQAIHRSLSVADVCALVFVSVQIHSWQ